MQAKDYYKILGVPESATPGELKKAFRKIAQDSHPDRHPGDKAAEERFKEASEAYDILSDLEKRQKYDALRRYGFGPAGFEGPGGFGHPGFGGAGSQGFEGSPGGFRVRFDTSGSQRDFDFAEIFAENSPFASAFEQLFEQMGIPQGERGRAGSRVRTRAAPGSRRAARTGPREPDHAFFRQDGLDMHCTVWLKLEQLERGAKVKVRTPSGKKALVTIPAHTKIGSVLRLPGMGVASGPRQGDQYVHIEAVT
jgi:DnaJ-class molecular chaperone